MSEAPQTSGTSANQTELPCERTSWGFKWGDTHVIRACEHKGHIVLMVETPRQRAYVRVTPTGLIRVDGAVTNVGEAQSIAI